MNAEANSPNDSGDSGANIKEFAGKVKDVTQSFGRVVKANALVLHRRRQSDLLVASGVVEQGFENRQYEGERLTVTDAYGFEIEVDKNAQDVIVGCLRQEQKQAVRWKEAVVAHTNLDGVPGEVMKKLCRKGIPPEMRKEVWTWMARCRLKRAGGDLNFSKCIDIGRTMEACVHQIHLDAPRTFPTNSWIQSDVGQSSLRRVLYGFIGRNQNLGYCQSMNYIAALLLLIMDYDEESAFLVMCAMIDQNSQGIVYENVYASNLSGCHVEIRTLQQLVGMKLPRLAKHMSYLQCDMSLIGTEWILCMYCTMLPSETTARVWDALLHEGAKVMYRVALALLKVHEPLLLAATNAGELLKLIKSALHEEFNRDELLNVAFDGIGKLAMNTINRYRILEQQLVDKEIALRETKERLRTAIDERGYILLGGEDEIMNAHDGQGTCIEQKSSWGRDTITRANRHVDRAWRPFQKLMQRNE